MPPTFIRVIGRFRSASHFYVDQNCPNSDSKSMRALSIRQPFLELILRGMKTVEYRSRTTTILGERFYLYAAKGPVKRAGGNAASAPRIIADNITVPTDPVPPWMIELATALRILPRELPTGLILGSAVIQKVVRVPASSHSTAHSYFEWHLADVQRLSKPLVPACHPQPVWFYPFK